jgi:hypothetical protein
MQVRPIASGSREKAHMGRISILMMALAVSMVADAQERRPVSRYDEFRKILAMERRVEELRPRRRDTPLRYLNISDDEVREIQVVAAKHLPKVLLNISPVVADCPCEEGPQCTDQVYILAESGQASKGLQLSRIKNSWIVGNVQQWWFRFDELRARANKMDFDAYWSAKNELLREFPACVGQLVPAENNTASAQKVESRK